MYVGTSSVPDTGRGGGSGVAADDAGSSITREDPLRGSTGDSGRGSGSRSSGVRGFAVRKLAVDVCGGSFESGGGVIRLHPSLGIETNGNQVETPPANAQCDLRITSILPRAPIPRQFGDAWE